MSRVVAIAVSLSAAVAGCAPAPTFRGDELYAVHCAGCHGRFGEGDGPAAADRTAPMPDLRYLAARNAGTYPRDRVIAIVDGRSVVVAHVEREMPIWGDAFRQLDGDASGATANARIEALADFIGTMQQAR
jgi:mono/diheme cytochrome c family protein